MIDAIFVSGEKIDLEQQEIKASALREKGLCEVDGQIKQLRKAIGPAVFMLAKHLVNKMRAHAIRQLEIVLDCALMDGERSPMDLVEEYRSVYEAEEILAEFHRPNQPDHVGLKDTIGRCFEARITAMRSLLSGHGETYEQLVLSRFATKENAMIVLKKEFEENAKVIGILEENPKLFKLPFGLSNRSAIDALRDYFEFSLSRLSNDLDGIYDTREPQ